MNKAISLGTSTSLVRLIHVGYTAFNVSVRTEQQLKYGAVVFQLPAATTLEAVRRLSVSQSEINPIPFPLCHPRDARGLESH